MTAPTTTRKTIPDIVIYDGNCNLCTTLVQALQRLDDGRTFHYIPMQDEVTLQQWKVTAADCELGMILIDGAEPHHRWQGSDAAEEIGRRFPAGAAAVAIYRGIPGAKWIGDRVYEQVRDNRYAWFGRRAQTYYAANGACQTGTCKSDETVKSPDSESR
ncbi:MAG: DCC1-like thiol-disulfide oxidoreductase family protein [Cyanobacteria bacterium J06642_2]